MQEWWNAYAVERLLAGEILAWGTFLVVMFMLIAMASIKYQQAFMTYFRADDVPADEFLAQQNRAFAARHQEMLNNGFSVWQTMRLKCANPPFQAAMAVYRHEGRRSLVGVLYAVNGQQACYTDFRRICRRQQPDGEQYSPSRTPADCTAADVLRAARKHSGAFMQPASSHPPQNAPRRTACSER